MNTDVAYLRLSDAFEVPDKAEGYEWTAKVLNINRGFNEEIKSRCTDLYGYSYFIDSIKRHGIKMSFPDAVDSAINECIEKDILAGTFSKHRREVKDMVLTEFDQDKYGEICKAEGIEIGKAEILNQQKAELIDLVHTGELSISVAAKLLHISEEEFSKLLK